MKILHLELPKFFSAEQLSQKRTKVRAFALKGEPRGCINATTFTRILRPFCLLINIQFKITNG